MSGVLKFVIHIPPCFRCGKVCDSYLKISVWCEIVCDFSGMIAVWYGMMSDFSGMIIDDLNTNTV